MTLFFSGRGIKYPRYVSAVVRWYYILRGIYDCGCFDLQGRVDLRVQVPNYHILSKIVTYITTILNPNT